MNIKFVFITIVYIAFTWAASNDRYSTQRLLRKRYDDILDEIDNCKFRICENVTSYPSKEIHTAVDQQKKFHSFFKGNVFITDNFTLGSRSGSNEENLCKSLNKPFIPKVMKDIANIARIIVNVKDYQQVLNVQVCENEEGECFKEKPQGYKTKCEQMYNIIKLVTINVYNHVLEYRSFKIPTTCVCTYKNEVLSKLLDKNN